MKRALADVKAQDFAAQPPDVQEVRVCAGQNRRALPGQGGDYEYFLNGTAPLAYCAPPRQVTSKGAQSIGVQVSPAWQPTPTPSPLDSPAPTQLPVLQTPAPLPAPLPSTTP
jgi:hypothetical protein